MHPLPPVPLSFQIEEELGTSRAWGSEGPMVALPAASRVFLWVFVSSKFSVRQETGHTRDHTQSRRGASQKPFPCN